MKRIIYLLLITVMVSCNSIPGDVKWEIVNEDLNEGISKTNIDIELNKKVSKDVLKAIAFELKKEREALNNIYISYSIEGTTRSGQAWATSHFNPDLKIQILGFSEKQDKEIDIDPKVDGTVIGKWKSDGFGIQVLFKNEKEQVIMRLFLLDGSKHDEEVKEIIDDGVTKYEIKNDEYYLIEDNSNLGVYTSSGKADDIQRID